jgi:uncharacterized delta-60 repeat protein
VRRTTCRIVGVALGCALVLVGASVPAWALEPGSLDPSFGGDGRVDRDFGSELKETGLDMVLQADGKVVVAGGQQEGGDGKFAVARYNPGGAFDTSFHGTGHLTVPIGLATSSTRATGVALTPSGKIVAAGLSGDGDFAVMRLGPGGTLDHSFSGDGKVVVGFGQDSFDEAFTTAVQPDG